MDDIFDTGSLHNEILNADSLMRDAFRVDSLIDPPPDFIPTRHLSEINPAKWTYQRLVKYINEFEKGLDDDHEIGARLVSFGNGVAFHIIDIGYYGPDIVSFQGMNENGEKVELIQNISQLNILLVAVRKLEEKPRRIGFKLKENAEATE